MASSDIEIRLSVSGGQQAEKQIEKVEKASINLGESAKGVGETFSSVGEAIDKSGGLMGSGFAAVGDSVMAVTESVSGMKDAFALAAETGGKAWLSLLGPAALLISAIGAAVEAFREFSGAAREAEMWEEAASATASDLTSRMEALAEEGIIPATAELSNFVRENQRARYALELLGLKNETLGKLYKQEAQLLEELTQAKKTLTSVDQEQAKLGKVTEKSFTEQIKLLPTLVKSLWDMDDATTTLSESQETLATTSEKLKKAELELAKTYEEEVIPKLQAALKAQTVATKTQLQLDDDLYAKLKEIESLELERLDLQGKSKAAIEKVGSATKTLTAEQEKRRVKERELSLQLKQNIITQEQYDASLIALKGDTYELTKSLDDQVEALNRELRAYKDADERKKRIGQGSSDREEKAFNRRVELLNRQKEMEALLGTQQALQSARSRQDALRDIAVSKLKTQEQRSQFDDLIRAIGGSRDATAYEKQLKEELSSSLQKIDKQILDEQLAHALKTEAKLSVNMVKLSTDALGYLEELLSKAKKVNKKTLLDIQQDYEFHYGRLKAQSQKTTTEQIVAEMESQSAKARQNKEFLLAREKENFDFSVREQQLTQKLRQQDLASLSSTEQQKLELLKASVSAEIVLANQKQARQKQDLKDRLQLAEEEYNRLFQIQAEMQGLGTDEDIFERTDRVNQQRSLRDQLYKDIELLDREHISQQKDLQLKVRQLELENQLFNKKFRDDELSSLRSYFVEESVLRSEISASLRDQELAQALDLKAKVDEIDKEIAESVLDAEESRKKIEALKALQPKVKTENAFAQMLLDNVSESKKSYDALTETQRKQLEEQEYILKDELAIQQLYMQKKENLLVGGNERILDRIEVLQQEARQKELEENRISMVSIANELKDLYITQVQTIASGLSTIFYDETADQKLKELEANRQQALDQYKGDMKSRAEIDKQYLAQKKAIETEDANMVSNLLKQTLRAVATEALMKSIYHTGLGIGALALGPLAGASAAGHFKAAAVFAGLATIAGMSSKAVGSGTGGASASTSLSPTGASQTTASPIREEAKQTEPIVFNINLSGNTIYDSRQAAEQAMADRIITMANRARRGAPTPSFSR